MLSVVCFGAYVCKCVFTYISVFLIVFRISPDEFVVLFVHGLVLYNLPHFTE